MNGDIPWHIFMALHYIPNATNKQYVSYRKIGILLERIAVTVKEYGQIEAELRSFYDPE